MKVLVTGASGYVGSAAMRALAKRAHDIVALCRPGTKGVSAHRTVEADLTDLPALKAMATTVDAVIHCAASDDPTFWPVSRNAALAIIESLGPGKAFATHGGSIVFGPTGTEPLTGPYELTAPPPLAGRAALDNAILAAGAAGHRANVVFGSFVYGGGRRAAIPSILVNAALETGVAIFPGNGDAVWSTVHVDDFGALLVDAVERGPRGGQPLFAAGRPVRIRDVCEIIAEEMGVPFYSATDEEAAAQFGMFAQALTINQCFSSDTARETCGWRPSVSDNPDSLRTALRELVAEMSASSK